MKEPLHSPDPDRAAATQIAAFRGWLGERYQVELADHTALQAFAIANPDKFWGGFAAWSEVVGEGSLEPTVVGDDVASARFFPAFRLNYTENLLAHGDDGDRALVASTEDGGITVWSRGQLRAAVARAAAGFRCVGMQPGDRVVAVARHTPNTVVAALAALGLGAIWSSAAPDLADPAILDRFAQLKPRWFFAHGKTVGGGRERPLQARIEALVTQLPSVDGVIALESGLPGTLASKQVVALEDLLADPSLAPVAQWPRFDFDHPLFVLFSSGTTGTPKCIVHGAGGTLLEHLKEHRLHTDLGPGETLYFHTTTGWMMWNWLLSGLASGAAIAMREGTVSWPEKDSLLRDVARMGTTVFGTSAAYVQYLEDAGVQPADIPDLDRVRLIQTTGSILYERQFHWLAGHWGPLPVHSISGGTDIVGCFVLGSPELPVFAGDSSCVSLGYDVRVLCDDGDITDHGEGELVCCAPFPSRPVGLFGDSNGSRFRAAWFPRGPDVWVHGDRLQLMPGGRARILGRSDGVLNIRGVRIGPAEIYRVVLEHEDVEGAVAVEQAREGGGRLVLFVVLRQGVGLERPLTLVLKRSLAEGASRSHVPAVIAQVPEMPVTHSGKVSERAVTEVVNGRTPKNLGALRNPECLEAFGQHPALGS